MDDDGRHARPIKGSRKRGHARQSVGHFVDTLHQRAAQASPRSRRRTHLAPEGKRLRARNFLLPRSCLRAPGAFAAPVAPCACATRSRLRRRPPTGTCVCGATSLRALLCAAPLAYGHDSLNRLLPTGTTFRDASCLQALLAKAQQWTATPTTGSAGNSPSTHPTPAQVPVPATLAADLTRAARRHQHRRRLTPGRRTPTPTGVPWATTTTLSSVTRLG